MDNRQRAKLDSYNRFRKFDEDNEAELATIEEYAEEQAVFDDAYTKIDSAGTNQAAKSGTAKEEVTAEKKAMADTVVMYAKRAAVKARQVKNFTLANNLDEPVTYMTQAPKTTAVLRAKNMVGQMNDNLLVLTNIKVADIDTMNGKIKAYDDVKDEPVESIQAKKATGTDVLPGQFDNADGAITNMIALVESYFGVDSEIADAARLAAQIIDTGIRHTSIVFTVLDEKDAPIEGATVSEVDGKTYVADIDGLVEIGTHKSGVFHFVVEAPNKQKVNLSPKIVRGQENDFTVKLVGI